MNIALELVYTAKECRDPLQLMRKFMVVIFSNFRILGMIWKTLMEVSLLTSSGRNCMNSGIAHSLVTLLIVLDMPIKG